MGREEAQMEYLKIVQDLDMYGINYFQIKVDIPENPQKIGGQSTFKMLTFTTNSFNLALVYSYIREFFLFIPLVNPESFIKF